MKKITKESANLYYKVRLKLMIAYLFVWFAVSFGVVLNAEKLTRFSVNGMPFHYFMGAQGAVLIFVLLLFVNAIVSDRIDKSFGINEKES